MLAYDNVVYRIAVASLETDGVSGGCLRLNTHPFTGDPLFVDPSHGNFSLAVSSSPAVDQGISTAGRLVTTDFVGVPRPPGAGVDLGAFEWSGSP